MKSQVQDGLALEVTMPYARESGEGVLIGAALFGVTAGKYSNAAAGVIVTGGVFDLAKAAGAISAGARVFWDKPTRT